MRLDVVLTALSFVLCVASNTLPRTRRFISGQGCFWGPQNRLSKLPGVNSCIAGYIGGSNMQPTYKSVCGGDGHFEAVQVVYDDSILSFKALFENYLDYWRTKGSALPPKGSQYSPCLFVESIEELEYARAAMTDNELKHHTIVLRNIDKHPFFSAEGWHQNYEEKQRPRNVLLALGVFLDLWPGAPVSLHQTGAALTCFYIVVTLAERYLQNKVEKQLV